MNECQHELYNHTMIAALNADRFGFLETARALRALGEQIKHSPANLPVSLDADNLQLMAVTPGALS